MSHILGIDTSSVELGIGLIEKNQNIAGFSRYVRNSHAELIADGIDFILKTGKITPSDIQKIAIAVGPGSFTGLRIGIAFIKGFCLKRDIKVLPVSSLESVAIGSNIKHHPIVVAIDARRDNVFWAKFRADENGVVRETEDSLIPVKEFPDKISHDDVVITDTLGYTKSNVFNFLNDRTSVYPVERFPIQRGLACARKGAYCHTADNQWVTAPDIVPQYLSKAYAGV